MHIQHVNERLRLCFSENILSFGSYFFMLAFVNYSLSIYNRLFTVLVNGLESEMIFPEIYNHLVSFLFDIILKLKKVCLCSDRIKYYPCFYTFLLYHNYTIMNLPWCKFSYKYTLFTELFYLVFLVFVTSFKRLLYFN